ncbi:MAG: CPBP family intramembrane glutamic endopeptidase, partial [Candidatus Eisenbacteria bacterium]
MSLALDLGLVALFALLWPLYAWRVEYPRLLAALARGEEAARGRACRRTILQQWPLAIMAVALWLGAGRPVTAIGLGLPHPWRVAAGLLVAAALVAALAAQRRAVRARPELLGRVRAQLGRAGALVPRTARERRWWVPLSITAGVCEEILFRGYLAALLATWIGGIPAALAASVIFGFAHLYLGRTGAIRAGIVGGVMAVFVGLTG